MTSTSGYINHSCPVTDGCHTVTIWGLYVIKINAGGLKLR